MLAAGTAALVLCAYSLYEKAESAKTTGSVVCIDAGHGGEDCGAIGSDGRYEKDDNLALALAVEQALADQDVAVVMTRSEDEQVSLKERCNIANSSNAVLFVSIHRNSADNADASGVEIWTASQGHGETMASYILENLEAAGISENRGVQSGTSQSEDSDYYVNKHTVMPSCLIEMGFVTNEEDNALLDANMETYAKAIADGIARTLADMNEE